jgi:hypothetical protein
MEDAVAYICWEAEGLRHHLEGAFSSKNILEDGYVVEIPFCELDDPPDAGDLDAASHSGEIER